jgi:hypothetical protein
MFENTRLISVVVFMVTVFVVGAASASVPPTSCRDVAFPGGAISCRDYTGDNWDPDTADADCGEIPGATGGTLDVGNYCDLSGLIGTCTVSGGTMDQTDLHFYGGDPGVLASNCENFLQGVWSTPIAGSCDHDMVFGPPGTPASLVCKQYGGSDWDGATALADCEELTNGVFADGQGCAGTELGYCTIGQGSADEYDLYFYVGNPAGLQGGCETAPPYGLGGVWTAAELPPTLDPAVIAALSSDAAITVSPNACTDDACLADLIAAGGSITFAPADGSALTGLAIYPGAFVEPRAYAVAARAIASFGYFVAIVPFEGGMAVTNPMAALSVVAQHPEIFEWAIAGHSMGGAAASIFAAAAASDPNLASLVNLQAIALWASYPAPAMMGNPAADLSGTALKATSITADLDGVLNWDNYNDTLGQLPPATRIAEIRGGNHAQFGYYGDQEGDNPAQINRESQHDLFVGATVHMLERIGLPVEQDVIHPNFVDVNDLTESICTFTQMAVARMRLRDIGFSDIRDTFHAYEGDFAASKPSFPEDGEALIDVTTHLHQIANPLDVSAPPILDGEVWCKMKTQEAITDQYGFTSAYDEGTCALANDAVFSWAFSQVDWETFVNYLFSDTSVDFVADQDAMSGPEWLSTDVAIADLSDGNYSVAASRLRTPLTMPPGLEQYAGNYYCRLWTPTAAVRFITERAATVEW